MNIIPFIPLMIPVLRAIVGNSGHKQLVDMLDDNMPAIQSLAGIVSEKVQLKNNNDRIIELLINKLPGSPMADSEKLEKMQIEIDNLKDMVLNIINSKDK